MLLLLAGLLAATAQACPPPVPTPSAAQLQEAGRSDRGALWKLEKDGRTSWLFGTLHLGRPEWAQPGPKVAAALAASDVLALELDPADPSVQQDMAATGSRRAPVLPAPLQARLARQLERACLGDALTGVHPAMQVLMLGLFEARWLGLDPAYAQEMVLAHHARAAGRRVVSLETAALQMQLLVPEAEADVVRQVEQGLEPLEQGSARGAVARMVQAWAAGDLALLEDYERWCECVHDEADRIALRRLNDDRNPALAARVAALHGEGRRVFAAVGALHMTGPQALPRLLSAYGFRVERVAFGAQ